MLASFGRYIFVSIRLWGTNTEPIFSDRGVLINAVFQIVILTLALLLWRIRGLSVRTLGLQPSGRLTIIGLGVYPIALSVYRLSVICLRLLLPSTAFHFHFSAVGLSIAGVVVGSTVNPFFEETLACGYIIHRMSKYGPVVAVLASVVVRLLYHTYQGVFAIALFPMSVLFAYFFWRYRQLWPLVIAHAIMDFVSLSHLANR